MNKKVKKRYLKNIRQLKKVKKRLPFLKNLINKEIKIYHGILDFKL